MLSGKAQRAAARPRPPKLASNERLRHCVQERLAGAVTHADGRPISGPHVSWKGAPQSSRRLAIPPRAWCMRPAVSRSRAHCCSWAGLLPVMLAATLSGRYLNRRASERGVCRALQGRHGRLYPEAVRSRRLSLASPRAAEASRVRDGRTDARHSLQGRRTHRSAAHDRAQPSEGRACG